MIHALNKALEGDRPVEEKTYKNIDFARNECHKIVNQIIKIKTKE